MHKSANVSKSNQGIGKGQFPGYLTTDQGVGGSNPLAHVKEYDKGEYLSKDRYSFLLYGRVFRRFCKLRVSCVLKMY